MSIQSERIRWMRCENDPLVITQFSLYLFIYHLSFIVFIFIFFIPVSERLMKSKILLSFLALVLIIKIIKIKLFWLLPLVIGVGAAKKLLLKFLLFLFPALSHLFKLCSYYQQTYHSTKYHHHHHHINHHHTVSFIKEELRIIV